MGLHDGKVALVTGSGRGLGRACAEIFAREGAKVVVATRSRDNGEETVRLIKAAGGEAMCVQADVGVSADVQRMVRVAVETFGGLDYAVNNAVHNIGGPKPLADISEEDWDQAMAVNFRGVFLCMKYEIGAMLARGGGAIVNIGSGNEFAARAGMSWYLGAKHGMLGVTKSAALDYAARGIRINALGPGVMWTPALRETVASNPAHMDKLMSISPMRRFAESEEVAEAAVWLCSNRASFVLGHTLVSDGGAGLG